MGRAERQRDTTPLFVEMRATQAATQLATHVVIQSRVIFTTDHGSCLFFFSLRPADAFIKDVEKRTQRT